MDYPFRAILSPIQFDDLSLPALGFAKSIAKEQGATLHLLHVVAVVSALGEPAINAMLHGRAEEKAIEALNDIAAKRPNPQSCDRARPVPSLHRAARMVPSAAPLCLAQR